MGNINLMEVRDALYCRSGGYCEMCGDHIGYTTFQMAHRIPQTKANIAKYGKEVIHHPLNLKVACGLKCNAKALIGQNKKLEEKLIKEIQDDLNKQRGTVRENTQSQDTIHECRDVRVRFWADGGRLRPKRRK